MERQFIHALVTNQGSLEFLIATIYYSNKREERKSVWEALPSISLTTNSHSWVVMGDFNEIRYPEERQGSDISTPMRP